KLHFVELQITTILVNRFLRQINSEPIKPGYSYTEEGYFESCKGKDFTVWRQLVDSDGREIMHVFDKQSNSIGFWLDSNSDFALLGFIFHHQDSPEKIQYSVTPKRYEELDHNVLVPRKDKDIKDPIVRSIDAKFAYAEYKKLQQYLKKSGIEIIPDFKIMVL
ncbi:MAG: hypothetical protein IH619_04745, partial [Ignavibacterium sp.]|nr:hypothetical protein [Ignavibacterium sp.]